MRGSVSTLATNETTTTVLRRRGGSRSARRFATQSPPNQPLVRRRPKLSLSSRKPSVHTERDRQRLLLEHNLRMAKPAAQTVNRLVERAHHRLDWARTQLYMYWNPEWTKVGGDAVSGAAAAPAAAAVQRREPPPLVMDARWWFWNLAFASLPAVIVFVYCEFRGQYLMFDYHRELELEQLKRLLGEEYVAQHVDELVQPPPQNLMTRLWNAVAELYWLASGVQPNGSPPDQTPQALPPEYVASVGRPASGPVSLEELALRLQRLEAAVLETPHHPPPGPVPPPPRKIEQMQQSGVQNRSEEALLESWRTRAAAAGRPQPLPQPAPVKPQVAGERDTAPEPTSSQNALTRVSQAFRAALAVWTNGDGNSDSVASQNQPPESPHASGALRLRSDRERSAAPASLAPVASSVAGIHPTSGISPADAPSSDRSHPAPLGDSSKERPWWPW